MKAVGPFLEMAREAPLVTLHALVGMGPVLVLAPHPDDESLGCGGLIAACRESGVAVGVALLTDGSGSHPGSAAFPPFVLAKLRLQEMRKALDALGEGVGLYTLGWTDTAAPQAGSGFELAVGQVVQLLQTTGATTLFCSWEHDPHCDHEAAARIATGAALRTGITLFFYPVWGWMLPASSLVGNFEAVRIDISSYLPRKHRAVECHQSQFSGLVPDCKQPFVLPDALLNACLTQHESYLKAVA